MKLSDRIQPGRASDYIDLNESEKNLYRGCGVVLVWAESGEIRDSLYVGETLTETELEEGNVTRIYKEIISPWVKAKSGGELYMGKMSCCQLCEPEPYDLTKAARLARWIIEEFPE